MENIIVIPNIQEFTQKIINGDLVLTRIIPIIDEPALFQKNLRGSTIINCKINNTNMDIHKYKTLLIYIYSITNKEIIIKNTLLNIIQEEKYDKGYYYYANLSFSVQGADTRRTLQEIINIIKKINCKMELKIKLKNGEIIIFMIEH